MVVSKPVCNLLKATSAVEAVRTSYITKGKPQRKWLTIHDVDVVINPNDEYLDEFMKGYGKQRLNFKRNDIDTWRECFKDRYTTAFVCLKGSKRAIHTSHFINYEAVAPHVDTTHQYQGFFWIDEEFRGVDSMKITDYIVKNMLKNVTDNAVAQCMPQTMNMWGKIYGHADIGHTMYVSYYQPDEMRVPEELKFDGIFVKSAHEVPDEDIVKYDQTVFPYDRVKYMLKHLRDPDGFGKVAYDEMEKWWDWAPCILQEIPLDDKKLLRFQIRSIDRCEGGYEWIQPFVKNPIRKQIMGYLCYVTHLPKVNYKKVFANVPYTTSAA
ncbi:unnamed protein product [Caenorhabditis sp. 36 PRJEB53466]|nr:unnamed protein product [Caenorhabditis sp. 36 PRJEB53466]